MAFLADLRETVRVHYRFTRQETIGLFISTLVVAFIFGFDDGSASFSWAGWISNYVLVALIVAIALLVHASAQKIGALAFGYTATFHMWSYGLGIGAALCILSGGNIILPLPGGIQFGILEHHRIGKYRTGLMNNLCGWVAAMGPIANVLAGMFITFIFVQLFGMANEGAIALFVRINFLLAFFTILPIPPLPGLQLFYGDRMAYVLVLGFMVGYVGLYLANFLSLFAAMFIAIAVWALYYFLIEEHLQ